MLSVRPEHWEVISTQEEGCFSASIISESFAGEHKEVICQVSLTDGTMERIVIYAPAHLDFKSNTCLFRLNPGYEPAILES